MSFNCVEFFQKDNKCKIFVNKLNYNVNVLKIKIVE